MPDGRGRWLFPGRGGPFSDGRAGNGACCLGGAGLGGAGLGRALMAGRLRWGWGDASIDGRDLITGRDRSLSERRSSWTSKIYSPATENAPIKRMRVNQTRVATKKGTQRSSCSRLNTSLPKSCANSVRETAHQVMMAFMVAPISQAPIRYHTAVGSRRPFSGVKRRVRPAKSIAQKATARMVAHLRPAKLTSPSKFCSANRVVSKLNTSKASSATSKMMPATSFRETFRFANALTNCSFVCPGAVESPGISMPCFRMMFNPASAW